MYRVSFTGYRPEKLPFFGEDDPLCEELKEKLAAQIKKAADDGAAEFCSGMAQGVDTWAAEAVLELKKTRPQITLTAVLPCPQQADGWSGEQQARYRGILARCDKVITCSEDFSKGCMFKRNRALVDMCDVLIAVYDGKHGGTRNTVTYAQKKGRKIILLPPV